MKIYKIKSVLIAVAFVLLVVASALNTAKRDTTNRMLVDSLVTHNDSLVAEVETVKSALTDTTVLIVVIRPDSLTNSPLSNKDISRISQQVVERIEQDSLLIDSLFKKTVVVKWTK